MDPRDQQSQIGERLEKRFGPDLMARSTATYSLRACPCCGDQKGSIFAVVNAHTTAEIVERWRDRCCLMMVMMMMATAARTTTTSTFVFM
jgi:hypothetical protein